MEPYVGSFLPSLWGESETASGTTERGCSTGALLGHPKPCPSIPNTSCPPGPGCPALQGKEGVGSSLPPGPDPHVRVALGWCGAAWSSPGPSQLGAIRGSIICLCPRAHRHLAGVTSTAGRMSTCEWKVPVAISAVTLVLHALLLLALYIMLSRKIASSSCSKPESSSPMEQPQQPPASAVGGEGLQRPGYEGSSDTSSETSEDSGSSRSCPQVQPRAGGFAINHHSRGAGAGFRPTEGGPCSGEDLNYTSLVFPGKGHGPGSTTDYVNVDPKKRKADFWPCSSPVAAKCMEYTEVKL